MLDEAAKLTAHLVKKAKEFVSVQEAIVDFTAHAKIATAQQNTLLTLAGSNDEHIKAIWTVYQMLKDNDDLLDSLKLLVEVKNEPPRQREEKKQEEQSSFSIRPPASVQKKVEEQKKQEQENA